MISDSLQLIFMHIPKTGGSSVTYHLRSISSDKVDIARSRLGPGKGVSVNDPESGKNVKHISIHNLIKQKPEYANYYKFTIVRNPYDRVMSYYFWHKGTKKMRNGFDKNDFKLFVRKLSDFQFKYITDPETGEILVDKIVKYETMANELGTIPKLKRFNFSNLPKLNVSKNNSSFYDTELKELVYNKFIKDFELFGYQK